MTKRKTDELEILEKLVKQKYNLFNLILVALPLLNTAKNDSKTKKTPSPLAPRLSKYKTVDKNGIKKFLAVFDARNSLQYDKDREYATNLRCKVCTQLKELKETILKNTGLLDQLITARPSQSITQKVSYMKKFVFRLAQYGLFLKYKYVLFEVLITL